MLLKQRLRAAARNKGTIFAHAQRKPASEATQVCNVKTPNAYNPGNPRASGIQTILLT